MNIDFYLPNHSFSGIRIATLKGGMLAVMLTSMMILASCASRELKKVRQMPIYDVDLSNIPDGSYQGDFTYGKHTYVVGTTVKDHRITGIDILSNRNTKHAKKAEGVIPRMLEKQTPNVDAVTGATTTSKALQKATENSLQSGLKRE